MQQSAGQALGICHLLVPSRRICFLLFKVTSFSHLRALGPADCTRYGLFVCGGVPKSLHWKDARREILLEIVKTWENNSCSGHVDLWMAADFLVLQNTSTAQEEVTFAR